MDDERVGQLIWAFISSAEDIDAAERAAREGRVGGIWLLPTQMHSPADTAALVNRLQAAAARPLLIGVDAEAGMGLVMGGATYLPTAMALGAARDPELVRQAAVVTAAEAHACGINMVAAPVLDVNVNPANPIINTRAFGGDPALVAALGVAFTEGLQQPGSGVLAIGKHFPGHGDTVEDSHLRLSAVNQPRARLEAVELPPFRAAIDAGVAMLMTAHVAYPALDPTPGLPATLSHAILTDLLRGEIGFDGAMVTDCMNMHAVAHNFDARDSAVRTVLAGCDLVLTDQWDLAHDALLTAAREGRLPGARLDEATGRVRAVKERLFGAGLARPEPIDARAATSAAQTPAHLEVAERIAAASITLARGALTPPSRRPLILATRMARRFGPSVREQLLSALAAIGWQNAEVQMLDPTPDAAQAHDAVERARAAGWAALLHFNRVISFDPDAVLASDELASLARVISAAGVPLAVASLGSPYVLPLFGDAAALLCGYSACDASVRATLRVLMGAEQPRGQLPVDLVVSSQ